MKAYTFFAKVYDSFMRDIPYVDWVDLIEDYLKNNGICDGKILELGCGTGRFSRLLAADGFDVTGIDLSDNMIKIAKKNPFDFPIKYYVADMRDYVFNQKYKAIVSVCDSMNYLLTVEDLEKTFLTAKDHLDEDGVFVFDLKTQKYFEKLGDNIFSDEIGKVQYFWENDYDSETRNNDYYISFFVKRGRLYKKIVEEHTQHAFLPDEIEDVAKRTGFVIQFIEKEKNSEDRVYYILKAGE